MPRKKFITDLAKLVIAAAWADGEVSPEERNVLKDLLFRLPDLTGEEYAGLEVYLESPVPAAERRALLDRVRRGIRSSADRDLVLRTLTDLVRADGRVGAEEAALLEAVKAALTDRTPGLLSALGRTVRAALGERTAGLAAAPGRELQVADYIRNTVYFQVCAEIRNRGLEVDVPEARLRKLCLAAGLMGMVAWVDVEIAEEETRVIEAELRQGWELSEPEARLVAEMCASRAMKGIDHFRVCRGFFEATTPAERKDFLMCLFRIANACDRTSHAEIQEIRRIAESIKVPHADFIGAKLTIPGRDRSGL
ncbi:MAG: TerB family tellurite resistance protein [Acidobacteria bacterium]|nr:TerB family tellurite resistance protein [Acidobacteriota bacterium]